jgi:hypothetical protein
MVLVINKYKTVSSPYETKNGFQKPRRASLLACPISIEWLCSVSF